MSTEFDRQCRVIDQMISAHSALRDRYGRLGLIQDVLVLLLSTILAAAALMDPALWPRLRLTPDGGRILLGVVSILVFASTVVDLRVRWKEKGTAHGLAAKALSELKSIGRLIDPVATPEAAREWLDQAVGELKGVPEVRESDFLRLKSRHLRKVALSKLLDRYPGASPKWLRLRLIIGDSAKSFRKAPSDE